MFPRYLGRLLRGAFATKAAYAEEGDDAAPNDPPGGSGGDGSKTFTQHDVDRMIGERLNRADAQFRKTHDLDGLTAKAGELDGIRSDQAAKDAAKRNADAIKSGDLTKITAEFDERLAAKDTALESAQAMFTGKLREAFGAVHVAKVVDGLHDGAKDQFARMVQDSLGVKFDMETQAVAVYPVGPEGNRAYNANGDPLTIDAVVKGLLEGHPYMRKPAPGGSGAKQGVGGGNAAVGLDRAKEVAEANPSRDSLAGLLGAMTAEKPAG